MVGRSCEALLEEYEGLRAATINLVREMSAHDLQKVGRHPFLGLATIEDIIKLIYRHNQIHVRDMRKVLQE